MEPPEPPLGQEHPGEDSLHGNLSATMFWVLNRVPIVDHFYCYLRVNATPKEVSVKII